MNLKQTILLLLLSSLSIFGNKLYAQGCDVPNPEADGPGTDATYCENIELIDYLFGAFIPDQFETDNPGYQVNWYSDAAGTELVLENSETFLPPNPFVSTTVYAQILNPTTNCLGELVPYTLTVIPVPTFIVGDIVCAENQATYTVNFTSDGVVTSDGGTVTDNQIMGIPSGTLITVNVTTATGVDCDPNPIVFLQECEEIILPEPTNPTTANVPTLSEWGIIVLLLLLFTISSVTMIRQRQGVLSTMDNVSFSTKTPLFNTKLFRHIFLKSIPFIAAIFLLISFAEGGFFLRNLLGTFVSVGIISYLFHFIVLSESNDSEER